MRIFLAVFLFASVAMGQERAADQACTPSREAISELHAAMPSEAELSELLTKADEKVVAFEAAVRIAKPQLDGIDAKYAQNYLDAASTAHVLIVSTIKGGASAYRLVGVLATLDDLSLDAANASTFLLAHDEDQVATKGAAPNAEIRNSIIALTTAGSSCNDIAELIFHATMRFVGAEDSFLDKLLENKK